MKKPKAGKPKSHDYLSTACFHGLHGECRKRCKFCDVACKCPCHAKAARTPFKATAGDDAA
jgi:hypothetical protein